jgi:hypothetical protein
VVRIGAILQGRVKRYWLHCVASSYRYQVANHRWGYNCLRGAFQVSLACCWYEMFPPRRLARASGWTPKAPGQSFGMDPQGAWPELRDGPPRHLARASGWTPKAPGQSFGMDPQGAWPELRDGPPRRLARASGWTDGRCNCIHVTANSSLAVNRLLLCPIRAYASQAGPPLSALVYLVWCPLVNWKEHHRQMPFHVSDQKRVLTTAFKGRCIL